MTKIFISYARPYESFARQLTTSLENQGLDVWLDVKDIPVGIKWSDAIQKGLDSAEIMLLILTPEAMESHNVADEWQYYLDEKKPIFPILFRPTPKIHFQIRRLQYIDFHARSYDDAFEQLCDELASKGFLTFTSAKPTSLSLMPAPFEWINIPAGRGAMVTSDADVILEIPTQPYQISKYPITNAQFAQFIEAGGYQNKQWWTEQGWETQQEETWTQPRYWTDAKLNNATQPVVGVSWYEAVAFCLWLSDVTGEKIMLPTEAQWQYAAQGNDGRQYPWGNDWDGSRCNHNVDGKGIGKTTPVRQFEGKHKGDSPFGVVDMAGNVWEWCLTDYANLTNDIHSQAEWRVLRGGSWYYSHTYYLRAPNRIRFNPSYRYFNDGVRCVLSG